ncbi:MAG: PAQR family membrane homeostasis protein TrhA [Bacillota bacterium]
MKKLREPISGLTHLIGAILSAVGLVQLIYLAVKYGSVWHVVSFSIFGTSLVLLYTASSLYHLLPVSERVIKILRRIDHMMIFVLIAGTYTPVCLVPLRGAWGWSLLSSVWAIALGGIIMKAVWIDAPRWLSTAIYGIMGWIVVVAFFPLIKTVPMGGMVWMVIGGVLYTIGALIYGLKWPRIPSKIFGFHEIFHLFVMGGSVSHYWLMLKYVLPL